MLTNILWSGIEYYSLENCTIDAQPKSIMIHSTILGFYRDKIYRVDYDLQLDALWNTYSCRVHSQFGNKDQTIDLIKKENKWFLNGNYYPEFDACLDVDLPLTPLTNSLPINRLLLDQHKEQEIDVIYINLMEDKITSLKQKYTRLSKDT
ncbi:MAG: putative glycolipid-binding protein, partial [Cytophagaceae bacterium]|nr:putative glycolipid-binding protein [Cytophagaceae bacterium]